ncbi:glycosyltransferase [Carboxylicivirga sediminis]|uniref:Glycosyltransferase n=1 Tax=Carboxylicivirga sediminis TaxID=2006564 RepID=A0A941F2W3_9BACT|nr:glycosyltransferase [Carboxylicivirga sediminis]MBR8535736.1 glycosyltransferase [Carboxylicivirga sediminis]
MAVSRKLLFSLESFFPSHRAGTEVYVLNLCHYFKQRGWDVGVLIATSKKLADYHYEDIPVYTFDIPERANAQELNGLIPPRGIEHFTLRIRELQPDIVHFHSFGRAINSFHLEVVKELGIKTAFTPHLGSFFCIKGDVRLFGHSNCDARVDKRRCMSCFLKGKGHSKLTAQLLSSSITQIIKLKALKNHVPATLFLAQHRQQEIERVNQYADIVFSIAPWIQTAFEINGITKAQLIPQGISPVFITSSTIKQFNDSIKKIHFAFIGRMHPIKGFHLLMQAFSNINPEKACLHVITIKDRNESEYYTKAVNWAKGRTNVIWNENLAPHQIKDYYSKIDCLIQPSVNEVSPLVSLESLSQKTPILCSNISAFKEQIKEFGGGLLFDKGCHASLAERMNELIKSKTLLRQLSKNIKKPCSMMEVAAIIEEAYKALEL